MKVLLIGSNGQLGSDILKTKPDGINLIALRRKDVDITERDKVSKVLKEYNPDWVINTAAFHQTDECEDNPEQTFKVNTIAGMNIAKFCKEKSIGLIYISTDYVFDGRKRAPYTEEDTPNPINVYGVSKYAAETFIRNVCEKYYIVRTSSLYGIAGASGKGGNFVKTIMNKATNGEKIRVVNDIYMSPTYTKEIAKKIWDILINNYDCGIYHISGSGYCSWYEFAKRILEFIGIKTDIKPISHTEYKTKAERPLWSALTSIKGTSLKHWEKGLKNYLKEEGKL